MLTIKQSDPRATKRRVYFTAVDVNNLQTRLQASDMSGGTWSARISKNGGTSAAIAGTGPTEVDATNFKGLWYVELAVADISTAGFGVLKIVNTGGTKVSEQREIDFEIPETFWVTVGASSLTTTTFSSDRTEANSFWVDGVIVMRTGSLAGQHKTIGAFANTNGVFTLATGKAFSAAPSNGDIGELLVR